MATKAAKSLTINATKFELANALAVENGKLQLKAKDVVLDEVDAPGLKKVSFVLYSSGAVDILEQSFGDVSYQSGSPITENDFIDGIKTYIPVGGAYVDTIRQETIPANEIYYDFVTTGGAQYLEVEMICNFYKVLARYDIANGTWTVARYRNDNYLWIETDVGQQYYGTPATITWNLARSYNKSDLAYFIEMVKPIMIFVPAPLDQNSNPSGNVTLTVLNAFEDDTNSEYRLTVLLEDSLYTAVIPMGGSTTFNSITLSRKTL